MALTPKAAIGFLRRAHENKRLAHAYLISGPAGSGKRKVAAALASVVNGTNVDDIFSNKAREIFVAEPESKSRRILIEQIRELEHGLQLRGAEGRQKVAIVAEADRLQPQAANAFLKTLEEPPGNSLLLLLSALPEALPDTIVSRARHARKIGESSKLTDCTRERSRCSAAFESESKLKMRKPWRMRKRVIAIPPTERGWKIVRTITRR